MTYTSFDDSSCTLTPFERRQEASRIVNRIQDCLDQMTPVERRFVESMGCDFAPVSAKQLWWLRDLNEKY
jgi:hypothetical protein